MLLTEACDHSAVATNLWQHQIQIHSHVASLPLSVPQSSSGTTVLVSFKINVGKHNCNSLPMSNQLQNNCTCTNLQVCMMCAMIQPDYLAIHAFEPKARVCPQRSVQRHIVCEMLH